MSHMIDRPVFLRVFFALGAMFVWAAPCLAGSVVYDKQSGEILAYYPNMSHAQMASDPKCACIETSLNLMGDVISHYRVVSQKLVPKPVLVISGDSGPFRIGVDTERIFTVRLVEADGTPALTSLSDKAIARVDALRGVPAPDTSTLAAYSANSEAVFVNGVARFKVISNQSPGVVYLRVIKVGAVSALATIRVEPAP
jgi:hypothetical protein